MIIQHFRHHDSHSDPDILVVWWNCSVFTEIFIMLLSQHIYLSGKDALLKKEKKKKKALSIRMTDEAH